MKRTLTYFCFCLLLVQTSASWAFEIRKSALYVFLHEVKPIEEEATKALNGENYALALRKYKEALQGYERMWKDFPDLPSERPLGIDRMVDESIETCKKIIEEIRDEGEAQDKFYKKLSESIRVDFSNQDIREVVKMLTFLTDVNIIMDEMVFTVSNEALDPHITIASKDPLSLKTIISRICQQTGLTYSVEADYVFITTRVKMDRQK